MTLFLNKVKLMYILHLLFVIAIGSGNSEGSTEFNNHYSNRLVALKRYSSRRLINEFTSNWTTSSSRLPRPDRQMAVGYYNDTLLLIGGYNNPNQAMEYNIITDEISIDYGPSALGNVIYGTGQFYTTINDILFMIDPAGITFSTFNLKTKWFTYNWDGVVFNTDVNQCACLASTDDLLFVVGGGIIATGPFLNTLQTLVIGSHVWLNTPAMNISRASLACIVHPISNQLYAIGGYYTFDLESIENINIADITNQQWKFTSYSLLKPATNGKAIVYENNIFIFGGIDNQLEHINDEIQVINVIDGVVSFGGYLDYGVLYPAVILVNDIIYVFGDEDKWQYGTVKPVTSTTTAAPTPTVQPTIVTTASTLNESYGYSVTLIVTFTYAIINQTNINDVTTLLLNVTGIIIDLQTSSESVNDCQQTQDNNITVINSTSSVVIIELILFRCKNQSQTEAQLLADNFTYYLEKELISTTNQYNNMLIINEITIAIDIDEIKINTIESTYIYIEDIFTSSQYTTGKHNNLNINWRWIIVVISIFLCCICVFILVFMYRRRNTNAAKMNLPKKVINNDFVDNRNKLQANIITQDLEFEEVETENHNTKEYTNTTW